VANNPAGEVALNMGITGPHYTIGAACAAGNAGLIQGAQMLRLNECDLALCGGVSESIRTFGIFASFRSQGALAEHTDPTRASRPFDLDRNGIVVAEGGCVYTLERLDDARRRGARIYGELVGYAMNTDATDFVLPNPDRQAECVELALKRAGLVPEQIDIVSTHATGTTSGDAQECDALRRVFGVSDRTCFQQHQELHRAQHGCGRRSGIGRQSGGLPRRRVPCDDQCRPTRSGMRIEGSGVESTTRNEPSVVHPEQLVRHARDQFRGHRQTVLSVVAGFAHGRRMPEPGIWKQIDMENGGKAA
jgi:hypothetical protein